MSDPKRGVLYIVWGDKCEALLQRSMDSVRRYHPELPIEVVRGDEHEGMLQKSRMGALTPFQSTLYLDADTVVMGALDHAFERAEQLGIACTICECPWLYRYAAVYRDCTEYNTGVIFFTTAAQEVFSTWERIAPTTPSRSHWLDISGEPRGLEYEDQASFALSLLTHQWNPSVLPMNWNFRPDFHRRFFFPVKIWHDYRDPPQQFVSLNEACRSGNRPVSLGEFVLP